MPTHRVVDENGRTTRLVYIPTKEEVDEFFGDEMSSKAKTHWENQTMATLRPKARKMGIDVKGLRKKQLIHEMRLKAQELEK